MSPTSHPRFFTVLFLGAFGLLSALVPTTHAQDPSDTFLKAYMAAQSGGKLEEEGKLLEALRKYQVAASLLDQINQEDPDWQPHVVQYRTRKTSESIARLEARLGDQLPEEPAGSSFGLDEGGALEGPLPTEGTDDGVMPTLSISPQTPGSAFDPTVGQSTGDVLDEATREIRNRIRQLEYELNTARREAVTLQQEKTQLARQLAATDSELKETLRKLDQSQLTEAELRSELNNVKETLKNAISVSTGQEELEGEIERLGEELEIARAERDLVEEENAGLTIQLARARGIAERIGSEREVILAERDKALAELEEARKAEEESERLLAENAELLDKLQQAEERIREVEEQAESDEVIAMRDQLSDLREQLVLAQNQNTEFQTTIAELEGQLAEATREIEELRGSPMPEEERKRLIAENEILRQIIEREMQTQATRDQARELIVEELARMEVESSLLMEQLDLLGQPVMKLSEQEAALLREGEVVLPGAAPAPPEAGAPGSVSLTIATQKPDTADIAAQESGAEGERLEAEAEVEKPGEQAPQVELDKKPAVPENMEAAAREAREYFAKGQYREAERLYEKILASDPNNLYALSNLGVTRFRSGRLKAAESTFKKAIAIDPEDSFSLGTLGIVYYRQGRYDDAINVLTKALAINPQNAIAHNYLGITASQKGWQEAAEKELLSAIALNPNYADAHFNLAVIYAVAQPPSMELARRHYRKATELGAQPDPSLEKLLE